MSVQTNTSGFSVRFQTVLAQSTLELQMDLPRINNHIDFEIVVQEEFELL